ncbi:hypothetical protein C7M52_02486 [Mixta theicola]|nr:hypothetical protein [Mixta theicola]QHM76510.1 hypothetical protein C7M52_02486 [Mixta theicola]
MSYKLVIENEINAPLQKALRATEKRHLKQGNTRFLGALLGGLAALLGLIYGAAALSVEAQRRQARILANKKHRQREVTLNFTNATDDTVFLPVLGSGKSGDMQAHSTLLTSATSTQRTLCPKYNKDDRLDLTEFNTIVLLPVGQDVLSLHLKAEFTSANGWKISSLKLNETGLYDLAYKGLFYKTIATLPAETNSDSSPCISIYSDDKLVRVLAINRGYSNDGATAINITLLDATSD